MIEFLSTITTPALIFGIMTCFFYIIRYLYNSKNKEHEEMYSDYSRNKEGNIIREKEHADMHAYYQRNKEVDMVDIKIQIARVLDRIDHMNDNNKAAAEMIMNAWDRSDVRMNKIEEKLNNHINSRQ